MCTSSLRVLRTLGAVLLTFAVTGPVAATTVSPVQSGATPLGVAPSSQVMVAGSDTRSAVFQRDVLPILSAVSLATLTERAAVEDAGAISVDPTRLVAGQDIRPRIYFLGEGAAFRNSLFVGKTSPTLPETIEELVFPDASSPLGYGGTGEATRRADAPLLPGDFVDLHLSLMKDERLTLTLLANGANGGTSRFGTEIAENADGLPHVIGLVVPKGPAEDFLLIGFEDIHGGGDEDYNDLLIAIDLGLSDGSGLSPVAGPLSPVPLPASGVILLLALGVFAWLRRRSAL